MGSAKRIVEYLAYKGITKYSFYKKTGLSNGFLDKGENIGSDKCEIIVNHYPDINVDWLITGRGNMIKGYGVDHVVNEPKVEMERPKKGPEDSELTETLKDLVKTKERIISLMEDHIKDLEARLAKAERGEVSKPAH